MKIKDNMGSFRAAQDCEYSLNDYETCVNNNVLAVGGSGTGKTMTIVYPNIYEAAGTYFILDPKGQAYGTCAKYLESKGYVTRLIDFTDPAHSEGYNPMDYIKDTRDIVKIAETLVFSDCEKGSKNADPFWDRNEKTLLCALIGYIFETHSLPMNFGSILKLNAEGERESEDDKDSQLRRRFQMLKEKFPRSWACEKFAEIDVAPFKTYDTIRSTLSSSFSSLDDPGLRRMMKIGGFDFKETARRKTAVFITISDTDRSMDILANIFFTQAMNELCEFADKECEGRLPVPVRFILDDFATNCVIKEFPRMIASIRSRGISAMLLIQAETQLKRYYGKDAGTIISNCDTYVYLGSNDLETAEAISKRCDKELGDVLYMPRKTCWVFRSGQRPVNARLIDPMPLLDTMRSKRIEMRNEI